MENRTFKGNNPLLNTVILQIVFENTKLKTLLKCREVCRTWKDVADLSLLKSEKFHVSFQQIAKSHPADIIREFRTHAETIGFPFPVSRFTMDIFDEHVAVVVEDFFYKYGTWIKFLNLKCSYDYVKNERIWQTLLNLLPNLLGLNLFVFGIKPPFGGANAYTTPTWIEGKRIENLKELLYQNGVHYEAPAEFLYDLISHSPNLESLNLVIKNEGNNNVKMLVDSHENIRKKVKGLRLINNRFFMINRYIDILKNASFKLTVVDLSKSEMFSYGTAQHFMGFLATLTGTLKKLHFPLLIGSHTENWNYYEDKIYLPKLQKLKMIRIGRNWAAVLRIRSFYQDLPTLVSFYVPNDFSGDVQLPDVTKELPSLQLKVLHFPGINNAGLQTYNSIFPNVEEIFADGVSTELFINLKKWKKLTHLGLKFSEAMVNTALIGTNAYSYQNLATGALKYSGLESVQPSLVDLQDLQQLVIDGPLSDTTVKLAILPLKNLTKLTITHSKVSKKCVEMLNENLPLVEKNI